MSSPRERFNSHAREILALAAREARGLGQRETDTTHILLALMRSEEFTSRKILSHIGVNPLGVLSAIVFIFGRGNDFDSDSTGLSPLATKVIERSAWESSSLGHDYIGTEHLLLALLSIHECTAVAVLDSLGFPVTTLQSRTLDYLAEMQTQEHAERHVKASKGDRLYRASQIIGNWDREGVLETLFADDPDFNPTILDDPVVVEALASQLAAFLLRK